MNTLDKIRAFLHFGYLTKGESGIVSRFLAANDPDWNQLKIFRSLNYIDFNQALQPGAHTVWMRTWSELDGMGVWSPGVNYTVIQE